MAPDQNVPVPRTRRGVQDGHLAVASKRLIASWQRSEEYGVSAEAVDPVWAGSIDGDSLFFQCGQEVLTDLHQTLANEPLSLMLTDSDGLVLNRTHPPATVALSATIAGLLTVTGWLGGELPYRYRIGVVPGPRERTSDLARAS